MKLLWTRWRVLKMSGGANPILIETCDFPDTEEGRKMAHQVVARWNEDWAVYLQKEERYAVADE